MNSPARHSERFVTESLGFPLEVTVCFGNFSVCGRHITYESETGEVAADAKHRIEIKDGLDSDRVNEVVAHEVYHLFYSVRNLIKVDEETEAEVFGQLVKRTLLIGLHGRWTKELPKESGSYWHWNGDEDSNPFHLEVIYSGHTESYFLPAGQCGWTEAQDVEKVGGWWMKSNIPEPPSEDYPP